MSRKIDSKLIVLIVDGERFIQSCDNREGADVYAQLFAKEGAIIKEFGVTIGKHDTKTNYALEYTQDAGLFSVWIPEAKAES
jgi:hypothetical protein